MTRTTPVLVAALLVVGTLAAFPVAGLAAQETTESTPSDSTPTESTPASNASENAAVAPGAQLSGVVAVGQAELDGDVESRAYGIQIARASTDDAKADVVAERHSTIEKRLGALEQRRDELNAARANGSMSDGQYRAKMAAVHARTESVESLANQSNETARGLPAGLLAEKGVNATAVRTLQQRASELSGPEVAAIARSIAGEKAGQSPGPDDLPAPVDRRDTGTQTGPGGQAGPGSQTGPSNQSDTSDQPSGADDSTETVTAEPMPPENGGPSADDRRGN